MNSHIWQVIWVPGPGAFSGAAWNDARQQSSGQLRAHGPICAYMDGGRSPRVKSG
jgi:hypothetical protein